jgi:hypothetical protein
MAAETVRVHHHAEIALRQLRVARAELLEEALGVTASQEKSAASWTGGEESVNSRSGIASSMLKTSVVTSS